MNDILEVPMKMKFILLTLMVAVTGGACSDGGLGENGLVRFSQIVDFKETDDFSAPFMVNKTMLIALQDPESAQPLTPETTFTELDLSIEADALGTSGQTFPLGIAQYAVILDGKGDYKLIANQDGEALDHMSVTAKDVKSMRLSTEVVITTDGTDCMNTNFETSLDDVVLRNNQTLTVYVVPLDDDDKPMLGFLNLTASGSSNVDLHSPLAGPGMPANALLIEPNEALSEEITITIKELAEEFTLDFTITTDDSDADVSCE
jgi:hypothetical protein